MGEMTPILIAFALAVAGAACLIALWDEVNHALDCALEAAFNP